MEKLFSIVVLVVMLFTLTSCTSDDNNGFNPIFLINIEDYENLGFNQLIHIFKYFDEARIYLYSFVEPEEEEFKLNGEEIDIDWDYHDPGDYWLSIIYEDEMENINFDAGEKVDYYIEVNNEVYEGELEMLAELNVDWNEFDFDEDFEFVWNIDEEPDIYNTRMYFWYTLGVGLELIQKMWKIGGNKNEFSISKNVYEDYEESSWHCFDVRLHAINYVNHGECLVWTETIAYSEYSKESNELIIPHERMQEILEMFKN